MLTFCNSRNEWYDAQSKVTRKPSAHGAASKGDRRIEMAKKNKKPDLYDTYNDLVEDFNTVAQYATVLDSILRPQGDGAREAVETEVKELFAGMRRKMQRLESLMCNKIWED